MIADEHLDRLKDVFVKHGVVLAYLFGSQAEGAARPSSDVDIAVLLPYDTPRSKFFGVRLSLTNELMDLLHKNEIDVVVLNEAAPLLAHQVVKHGKVLYEDEATRPGIDFIVYTSARYSDSKPARDLTLRYLTERVAERRRVLAERSSQPYRWSSS